MQNAGNTCYISSVTFAMFNKNMQAYDGLLQQALTESRDTATKAQTLQFFLRDSIVNPLRKGQWVQLVDTSSVKFLRQLLAQCNWQGGGQQSVEDGDIGVLTDMGFDLALARRTYEDSGKDLGKSIEKLTGGGTGGGPVRMGRSLDRQEDAHEFFLFLLDVLQAPRLTIHQTLFHGGELDSSDDFRLITGRCIELAMEQPPAVAHGDPSHGQLVAVADDHHGCLPQLKKREKEERKREKEAMRRERKEEGGGGVQRAGSAEGGGEAGAEGAEAVLLHRLLWNHFFEDQVVAAAPPSLLRVSGMQRKAGARDEEEEVEALKVLKLHSFYTTENEIGEVARGCEAALFPSVVVPIVLQRYGFDGSAVKDARPIPIPASIDFTEFVASESSASEHKLMLQSAVLHLGERVNAGHYVAIARDASLYGGKGGWVMHDDTASPVLPLRTFPTLAAIESAGFSLQRDSYILFYQLQNTTAALTDEELARNIKSREDSLVLKNREEVKAMVKRRGHKECAVM